VVVSDGDTVLHYCENPAIAELLIRIGVSPLVTNNAGETPAQQHLDEEEEEMVSFVAAL
jgi:hypothetical protein